MTARLSSQISSREAAERRFVDSPFQLDVELQSVRMHAATARAAEIQMCCCHDLYPHWQT